MTTRQMMTTTTTTTTTTQMSPPPPTPPPTATDASCASGPCECSSFPVISGDPNYCDDYTSGRGKYCDKCCLAEDCVTPRSTQGSGTRSAAATTTTTTTQMSPPPPTPRPTATDASCASGPCECSSFPVISGDPNYCD